MTARANKKRVPKIVVRPTVIWAILAREFVSDRRTGSASAINIVEDIYLPASSFVDGDGFNVINLDQAINLAFTVDWRWPTQIDTHEAIAFKVDWHTPSGHSYAAEAGQQVLNRPTEGNRSHVEVGFGNLPIEGEGVYHFEVLFDGNTATRYPVRIWKAKEEQNAPDKMKRKSRKSRTSERGEPHLGEADKP